MVISEKKKKLKGRIVKFLNFYLKIYIFTFLYNESTNVQLIDNVLYCSLFIVQNNKRYTVQVFKYRLTFHHTSNICSLQVFTTGVITT
jgi:hypothetical protein